jgi:hypothetical protein
VDRIKDLTQTKEKKMNIKDLVTEGFKLDIEIKEKQKRLSLIKEKLRILSAEKEKEQFHGAGCFVSITDRPETKCNVKELYKYCQENNLKREFFKIVSVSIKDARETIGEDEFKKISSSMTTQKIVSFKSAGLKRR